MIKNCEECGNPFSSKGRQKYCCKSCRDMAQKRLRKIRESRQPVQTTSRKKKKRESQIDSICIEARNMGMSYGKYQALRHMGGM